MAIARALINSLREKGLTDTAVAKQIFDNIIALTPFPIPTRFNTQDFPAIVRLRTNAMNGMFSGSVVEVAAALNNYAAFLARDPGFTSADFAAVADRSVIMAGPAKTPYGEVPVSTLPPAKWHEEMGKRIIHSNDEAIVASKVKVGNATLLQTVYAEITRKDPSAGALLGLVDQSFAVHPKLQAFAEQASEFRHESWIVERWYHDLMTNILADAKSPNGGKKEDLSRVSKALDASQTLLEFARAIYTLGGKYKCPSSLTPAQK